MAMSMTCQVSDVTEVSKHANILFCNIRQVKYCLKFSFVCVVM